MFYNLHRFHLLSRGVTKKLCRELIEDFEHIFMLDGSFMETLLSKSMESKLKFLSSEICLGSSGVCMAFQKRREWFYV